MSKHVTGGRQRPVSANCYHSHYQVGQAVRLIQFYADRPGQPTLYLPLRDVIALSKIHARYVYRVKVRSVVVIIDEQVIHNDNEMGFIATGTHPDTQHLVIAHHQYPTYRRRLYYKHRWMAYSLNLRYDGGYTHTPWEDLTYVQSKAHAIRYRNLRETLSAFPPCL